MSRTPFIPISKISWATALFPISMVLYEFCTYIANDMIIPAMPTVVREFGVGEAYIPTGMSAYLAGGAALQWLLGPLSDKMGRRPVMLSGAAFFVLSCLAMLFVPSIFLFILLRFVQGFGLCFVVAVGYAAIQEAYTEDTALKVTALMANVALIAPLLGPLAGALMTQAGSWRWIFVAIAALSAVSVVGLWKTMPETVVAGESSMRPSTVWKNYRAVFTNRGFLLGSAALSFAGMPLLAWIGQSPVIFIERLGMTPLQFGLLQIPIFTALIAGNLHLSYSAGKLSTAHLITRGTLPLLAGLTLGLGMLFFPGAWMWLILSMSVYAYGMGQVNAVLYRLALYSSDVSKGAVSASLGMVMLFLYAAGIEIVKFGYGWGGNGWFTSACMAAGVAYWVTMRGFLAWSARGQSAV